jgi:hypothetical protein
VEDVADDGRGHREDRRARRGGAGERRGGDRELIRRLAWLGLAAACAPAPPAPPPAALPPLPPPPLVEEPLPGDMALEVGPIRQTESADRRTVFVDGTVRNVGSRVTRELHVRVVALDADGTPVATADDRPSPQEVLPGTAATYTVRFANDRAIRTFHVEAVGR